MLIEIALLRTIERLLLLRLRSGRLGSARLRLGRTLRLLRTRDRPLQRRRFRPLRRRRFFPAAETDTREPTQEAHRSAILVMLGTGRRLTGFDLALGNRREIFDARDA